MQLFSTDYQGWNAIIDACRFDAPINVVQVIINAAKLDWRGRNYLEITSDFERDCSPLRRAAPRPGRSQTLDPREPKSSARN